MYSELLGIELQSVPNNSATEDHVDILVNCDGLGPGDGSGSQPSPSNRHADSEQQVAFLNMLSPDSEVETSQTSLFDTTALSPIFTAYVI